MRGIMKGAAAVLGSLLILGTAAYRYLWYAPAPYLPSLSAAAERRTVQVGDRERTYLAYVPANLPPGSPLVIVLHGSAMDGATMRRWTGYEFDRLADRDGFVVLYPDGYKKNWNDCRRDATYPARLENVDDIGFIRVLIERFVSEKGVDPRKVFAFGYSSGGQMAHRLAIETPDMVAAVATAGANIPAPDNSLCPLEGRTARVMLVSGTDDPIVPFHGGEVSLFGLASRGMALSAMETGAELARRNGITTVRMWHACRLRTRTMRPRSSVLSGPRSMSPPSRSTWCMGRACGAPASLPLPAHAGPHDRQPQRTGRGRDVLPSRSRRCADCIGVGMPGRLLKGSCGTGLQRRRSGRREQLLAAFPGPKGLDSKNQSRRSWKGRSGNLVS
ncbi:alpha/beta hydrolase family esterase [Microvirga arabica]|uniref:alpha/beta hydrolase family esterase n=1 Tax=Microvirga arabica TaxID=1128671 RepID=UPI00360DBDAB